jgi:hypothetical protein
MHATSTHTGCEDDAERDLGHVSAREVNLTTTRCLEKLLQFPISVEKMVVLYGWTVLIGGHCRVSLCLSERRYAFDLSIEMKEL